MINANLVGNRTRLTAMVTATSDTLPILPSVLSLFDPGAGKYTYVTMRHDNRVERIKVSGVTTTGLVVAQRGVDGTTAQQFPANACVEVEWSPSMVCEFVATCNGAIAPSQITLTPQTVCMGSCACIAVGADGRITKITTAQTC